MPEDESEAEPDAEFDVVSDVEEPETGLAAESELVVPCFVAEAESAV